MYRVAHLLRSSLSPLNSSENTSSQPADQAGFVGTTANKISIKPSARLLPLTSFILMPLNCWFVFDGQSISNQLSRIDSLAARRQVASGSPRYVPRATMASQGMLV